MTVRNPTRGSFSFRISSREDLAELLTDAVGAGTLRHATSLPRSVRREDLELAVDDLDLTPALDELLDLVQHAA